VSTGTAPLFSTNWYRVAGLRPRMRGHVHIHRHAYRGQIWYVIEDRVGRRYHRFNAAAYRVINLLDGTRTMEAVWKRLTAELVDTTPSQDEIINLLGQLHASDLIQCDIDPDVVELLDRRTHQQRRKFLSQYLNPLALRFPLWDPEQFLARLARRIRFLNSWWGVALWLLVVLPALFLTPMHWRDLTENFTERFLAFNNVLVVAVAFPLIKAMHELGHGLVTKLKGGEVHEMGIMLLVLFPIPYVDASSASAFVKKTDRMLVGAAGMLIELFVAALTFYVWLLLEPGLAKSIAYNVIVLASITTVLFNANPLLRYDGYYILADWAELPNLGTRSTRYWRYLADRYLLGVKQTDPPNDSPGERRWFLVYAPLALAYRLFVMSSIALFVAQKYFIIGALIAIWGLVASLAIPLIKAAAAVTTQPRYTRQIPRTQGALWGVVTIILLLIFVVPAPYHTIARGVVWLPEQAILRAESKGFVSQVVAKSGDSLVPGAPVLVSDEPSLSAGLKAQAARVAEARARYDAAWGVNPAQAAQLKDELRREEAVLDRLQDEANHQTVRAAVSGNLILDRADDLPGRFIKKGEMVGYVVGEYVPIVRVVVPQSDVEQIGLATRSAEVMLPQDIASTWPAKVVREVPAAGKELPSPALSQGSGGEIPTDPRDQQGKKTLQSLFEFELQLPASTPALYLGSRVYVRFEHPPEPIGVRGWQAVRRLFLSHFHV
jgi:putative peptide zinc metalloprotease protein